MPLVALAYHAIADLEDDAAIAKWSVSPPLFARQLEALAGSGWSFVDLDRVLAALSGAGELPRRSILITFDDAYADLLSAAWPVLERHAAPAVVFAVAGQTGGSNAWDEKIGAPPLELLDADGLRAAAAHGIEVGSHTVTHPALTRIAAAQRDEELSGSAAQLEALGLPRPRAFAYPFGDCDAEVAAAAASAGYELAFTIRPGVIDAGADRFLLPRLEMLATDSPRALRLKLATAGWPERWRLRVLRRLRVAL